MDFFNKKSFDTRKPLPQDFINRFICFVEKYDKIKKTNTLISVKKWLNDKDYSYIGHFLHVSPVDTTISFNIGDFLNLSVDDFIKLKNSYEEIASLLDEQHALYEEFSSLQK